MYCKTVPNTKTYKRCRGAGEMAWLVKVLVAYSDDPGSIPGAHMVEVEHCSSKSSSGLHMQCCGMCTPPINQTTNQ